MRYLALLLAFCAPAAFAQASLNAPQTARVGAPVGITIAGSKNPQDFAARVSK